MTKVVHEQLRQEMEHSILEWLIIINSDEVLCMKAFFEWEYCRTMCGSISLQLDDHSSLLPLDSGTYLQGARRVMPPQKKNFT